MDSRRHFIGTVAGGIAGTLASPPSILGSGGRLRIGVIGPGDRGLQLAREAAACGAELVAFADVYTKRLDQARTVAPDARSYQDYRELLGRQDVDAVIIATPHHLHCEQFIAALEAGKHVYQEKPMAFTVEQAGRMRAAYRKVEDRLVVQVGHQACSFGMVEDARAFTAPARLGRLTAIQAHMYRNTPHGKPQWTRPIYPDMNPDNVRWGAFLGEAPQREFDANRYANWRLYWDYSGGNVFENMCHQLAFWYKVLGLRIPRAATMSGGVFLWKDGREVPDTMNVALEHSEEILFSWVSGFGNNHLGSGEEVLGTDGTVSKGHQIRYTPQKVNQPAGREVTGHTPTPKNAHMQDWFQAIRDGRQPGCPFELGYRVSIACRMAVESYRLGRTVHWDAAAEEIV